MKPDGGIGAMNTGKRGIARNAVKRTAANGNGNNQWPYHLMLLPGVLFTLVYAYVPMLGLVMVFQNFQPLKGFFNSAWVGMDNFWYIFSLTDFWKVVGNTLYIAVSKICLGLAASLTLAVLVNEVRGKRFAKTVQTTVFLPYFLSWAILGGVVSELLYLDGPINAAVRAFGGDPVMFLSSNRWFPVVVIAADVWKSMGYNMVIFLAAITSIDPTLYEAAEIDGAGRWRKISGITLPGIKNTVVVVAVLGLGNILNAGFEEILILYNPVVYESGDIIDTLVYRMGIFNQQYSHAAAIGLFKSVTTFILVVISYFAAYKATDYRLF
jgi:putative aldouronate transport system permease protein